MNRRKFLAAATTAALPALLSGCSWFAPRFRPPERGPIVAMFPGAIDDGSAIEAGYRGLIRVRDELEIRIDYVDLVPREDEAMKRALRTLARSDATLVIAYGSIAAAAAQRVAWEYPEQRFAVIQGNSELTRPNLAVYRVQHEQSAWLAGAAAGLLTRTGVVGHIGGTRSAEALAARAAFAHGLATANGRAKLLTRFLDAADDPTEAARELAMAEIDARADLIYLTLDTGRVGPIEACRERGVKMIGDVADWVAIIPEVFVASAVADAGAAVFRAARDLHDNVWGGDIVRRIGIRDPSAVRLALGDSVPADVRDRLDRYTAEIGAGRIVPRETWTGEEYVAPRPKGA